MKKYRVREFSPIWWARIIFGACVFLGAFFFAVWSVA
jgi:hypothetical protein